MTHISSQCCTSEKLPVFKRLRDHLKEHHPANILMPGRNTKGTNGAPMKCPLFPHKDDVWTWQCSDAHNWRKAEVFGLLLKDLFVIDFDRDDVLDDYEELFPCLKSCPKESTRKGAHYFFKRTPLCDELRFFDGSRGLEGGHLPGANEAGILPIDIKTVCSSTTCGFLVVAPSQNKGWVPGREPWSIGIHDLPDDVVRALAALRIKGKKGKQVDTRSSVPAVPARGNAQEPKSATNRYAPPWEDLERIVRGLSLAKRFGPGTYQDWKELGWAMHGVGGVGGYPKKVVDLFDELSLSFPDTYSEAAVMALFDGARNEGPQLGYRHILSCLNEDNPVLYREVIGRNVAALPPLIDPERAYDAVKSKFEQEWFKLSYPPMFVQLKFGSMRMMNLTGATHNAGEIVFEEVRRDDGRKQVADVPFFPRWVKDAKHRCYDSMDFLPPPMVCPEQVYNTFPGFRAALLPPVDGERDLAPVLDLIHDLCDRDQAAREYIVHFMAHICQKPGSLPGTGIIMKSRQGRGKNTLWGTFLADKILGGDLYYSSANPDHFFGRFANGMVNKLLTNFNEVEVGHTSKIMGLVKEAITEPYLNYEKKGLDVVRVHNFARQVWFSNEIMPIKIAADDRRWMAVQASDGMPETGSAEHAAYFKRIHDWIADDGNVRAFYDMLLAVDLTNWNAERDRPRTSFYTDLQQLSLNRVDQWLVEQVENDTLPPVMLSQVFTDSVNATVDRNALSAKMISNLLRPYTSCPSSGVYHTLSVRVGVKTGKGYRFDTSALKQFLAARHMVN